MKNNENQRGTKHNRTRRKTRNRTWIRGEIVINFIKSQPLKWAGYIMRKPATEIIQRISQWGRLWSRREGRSNKTWLEAIDRDRRRLGIYDGQARCKNRKKWRKITHKAKTHKKLWNIQRIRGVIPSMNRIVNASALAIIFNWTVWWWWWWTKSMCTNYLSSLQSYLYLFCILYLPIHVCI